VVARFSAPDQTGPGDHLASCTIGIGFFSPGVKRPGRGVNHPPQSSSEVKESVDLYLYFPSRPSWQVIGFLYLTLVGSFYGIFNEALRVTFISSVLAMGLFLPYSPDRAPSEAITRINVFWTLILAFFWTFYVDFVFCDFLKTCHLLSASFTFVWW